MQQKNLKGVKYYNDCLFRGSYYHQLIAGYSFFKVPPEYLVCNYTIDFEPYEKGEDVRYDVRDILPPQEFAELTGIYRRGVSVENLEKTICDAIRSDRPIVIGVDSYYLPYRKNYYKKKHSVEYMLIHGVYPKKKMYTASVNKAFAIFHYEEEHLSYEVVQKAFDSFVKMLDDPEKVSAVLICPLEKVPVFRRVEAFDKLNNAYIKRDYNQYASFYKMVLDKKWTQKELKKWWEFINTYTNFLSILLMQFKYMFGKCKRTDAMAGAWDSASHVYEVYKKAMETGHPELLAGEDIVKAELNIEERMKYITKVKTFTREDEKRQREYKEALKKELEKMEEEWEREEEKRRIQEEAIREKEEEKTAED